MAHMFYPGQNPHHEHGNDIAHCIVGIGPSFDGDPPIKNLFDDQLFGKLSEENKPGISGDVFCRKFDMYSFHSIHASINCTYGGNYT